MLDFKIRKLGAKNSFPTIVAFGPNASRPHHQPSRKKLKQKDTVLIDFGAKYKGYCSDITRCFAVGRPTTFYKKVYDVVEQSQAAAIKMITALAWKFTNHLSSKPKAKAPSKPARLLPLSRAYISGGNSACE